MTPDPNDEILATKRRLAAKFNNDIHRIAADVRERQGQSGHEILSLPARRCEPIAATNNPVYRTGDNDVSDNDESTPATR
ncbi:MAG: hypothetical protein ABI882_21140 [Acidobacteriota bacterium]